ncbi:MAG: DUF11 domain-containing protein, partial [Anaerolineae bacterium]|nr:DUF11 domain-containing protein [Anaerolineae bacterium]
EVEKTVAIAAIVPNQVVTYTITITNTGGVLLNPVQLTDTLEAGLNYISGSASPAPDTVSGQQLIWNDVTAGAGLAPGADTQVSLLVSVTTITGTYVNTALAEGTQPTGTITDTDDVSVIVSDPAVELSKHVVSPGAVDGIITFTIELTNTGPSTLEQVPLFDRFTGPVEYIGGNVVADSIDNTNGVLSWNDLTTSLGDMAPGQVFLIETVFQITADSTSFSMTNFAEVSEATDTFGNEADDDSATVTLDNEPTAIDLLYFRGNRQGENVILNWATAVEIDNYGFRLFRSSTTSRADAVEIAFVPGQGLGTGSGATYTYTDKQVDPNQTYTYWLVDIDLNGTETDHPSLTVTPTGVDSGDDSRLYLPLILHEK